MGKTRQPVVAGFFYPGSAQAVDSQLTEFLHSDKVYNDVLGAVVPHAGWSCSGLAAGMVFASMAKFDTYIILGPNHNGLGSHVSIMSEGQWILPNGLAEIDSDLAKKILNNSDIIEDDPYSHSREHSIEVQVPFILKQNHEAKIVPISIFDYSMKKIKQVAEAITTAIKDYDKKVVIIASSDMTHYEPADYAEEQDYKVIPKIEELSTTEVYDIVHEEKITMCGLGPICITIEVCKNLGAKEGKLLIYTNSGRTCAPESPEVVGYAGLIFTK